MSCAEALRRCPQAIFVPPRHSELPRATPARVWAAVREVVPTVEQTGVDEGYLDVGEVAPDFRRARVVAEAVQAAVRGATSLSCSLGVASCKVVAKVASDRRKPGGDHGRAGRARGRLPRAAPGAPAPGRRAEGRGAAGRAASRRSAASPRSPTTSSRGSCRGNGPAPPRPRARDRSAPARGAGREHLHRPEETFPRDVADRERLHEELAPDVGPARRAPDGAARSRVP